MIPATVEKTITANIKGNNLFIRGITEKTA
jgi:hypothetical protein